MNTVVNNDPNNEEYKLDDLELLASEPDDQLQSKDTTAEEFSENENNSLTEPQFWESPIFQRGALVLVGLIVFFLCYRMVHSFWSAKTSTNQIKPVAAGQNTFKPAFPQPVSSAPVVTEGATSKKLQALQQQQGEMNASLQTLNSQVNTMGTEVSDVSSKITALSASVAALSEKLDSQTKEIERLMMLNAKRQIAKHHVVSRHGSANPSDSYSIQALIPGRAWLISSSGSSMTVREGSIIPGYGAVKLIDVERGRVLTSSGRVIKFGQVDS
jgi:intracellular multiplication protein IcmG